MDVFVTGFGVISALGCGVDENFNELKENQTGISKAIFFESSFVDVFPFGEVKKSTEELHQILDLTLNSSLTRTDLFALIATQEAIKMANLSREEVSSFETALITSSTVGGMVETDFLYEDSNLLSTGSPFLFSYGSGAHTQKLIEHFKFQGYTDTINTACSSSANAIMMGVKLIRSGKVKRAIVGGTDSLSKFTINGFNSLQILSKKNCSPFSSERDGLNLGEGAGYLVLESSEVVKDKKLYAKIIGYGNSNDAFHPTALSDDAKGVIDAMKKALISAKIKEDDIDFINMHGTATENNDRTEIIGIKEIFKKIPLFNSTKSYTGHTLAAAGSIEAIYSILSIQNNLLFKSLNSHNPIVYNPLFDSNIKNIDVKIIMSNSFGFGGNCSSLIISKI